MPANRKSGLMGAGLMFLAGCVNLFFHASPRVLSFSTPAAVAAADTSEDDGDSCADTTDLAMAMTAWKQVQQRKADPISAAASASVPVSASVSGDTAPVGGDIAPARTVADAYPSFHSVAVDPEAGHVVISDSNRGALLLYDRTSGDNSHRMVSPKQEIRGPRTGMMFVAGISLDLAQREIFAVNNDIGDRMEVFSYDMEGNIKPKRVLAVPHGVWGVSFDSMRQEVAISVEHPNTVVVYRRDASGSEAPLRVLHGRETELADPHGIVTDAAHNEMLVANHGNWAPLTREEEEALGGSIGGHFALPSINTYGVEAKGDEKPIRKIQGSQTQLNWPMGMSLDAAHDEFAVANYGTNSVLFFRRDASGNVAPVRVIKGNRTGIVGPMGVAIDVKNDELWVTNYSEHTAVVFARTASGNVAPKRVLHNAPAGTPAVGFGNPGAIAYDSRRDQILVPNCVSVPRIMAFSRLANGNQAPVRVIEGQASKLSRTMHGIAYDPIHDEIVVPVHLAGAVLFFKADANGEEAPVRIIQGPHTRMLRPETVNLDLQNNEIVVGEDGGKDVLFYPRDGNGDVPPLRTIRGEKTGLDEVRGVAVDPVHNLVVVGSRSDGKGTTGVFIFNRTDNGDVAPRAVIAGPRSGIIRIRQVEVDPGQSKIFVAVKNNAESYRFEDASPSPWNPEKPGFIGVWDINDKGDVPPRGVIKGPASEMVWPAGVALNPADREVYTIDSVSNGMYAYYMPEFFPKHKQ